MWGWVGYMATFGLLSVGCLRVLSSKRARRAVTLVVSVMCSLLAINLPDSIPNASVGTLTWLIAGTLATVGLRESLKSSKKPYAKNSIPMRSSLA